MKKLQLTMKKNRVYEALTVKETSSKNLRTSYPQLSEKGFQYI